MATATPSVAPAGPRGPATLVYYSLLALVVARILVTPWATMWLWGLNTPRFLLLPAGLMTLAAMAVPFSRRAGRPVAAALAAFGDRLAASRAWRLGTAALAALGVWTLDDRTQFIGDALIRNAASGSPEFLARFRQALPLELLLFERLPLALEARGLPAGMVPRLIGLAAAFALALAALGLGRELARRGAGLLAVASLVGCGGWLATFTGLGKPAAVLCALTAIAALAAMRAARRGQGIAILGVAVFAAMALHRAGVLLLPAWALGLAVRAPAPGPRPPRALAWALAWASALLPLVALALFGPRILHIAATIDVPAHVTAADSPWRALDLANLALLLSPAAAAVLPVAIVCAARWARTREALVLLALAGPWLAAGLIAVPAQGLFRDLDFFAPAGVASGALAAWLLCRLPDDPARAPRLAAAVTLTSAAGALQLLLCFHDPAGGLERVRAWLAEPPARTAMEREPVWDFLALRAFALRQWPLAATASEQASRIAPNPRLLIMLGIARTYVGDDAGADSAYRAVLERSPYEPVAWAGRLGIATRHGRRALADTAIANVRLYSPATARGRELRAVMAEYPEAFPAALR